jgi:S-ribosylhomocysteine lyase LuxS involved in autoinducer biosynthesis
MTEKGEIKMANDMNVESFNLDHTKVKAPYIRLASTTQGKKGDVVSKFDIRFKQPNKEHMKMDALHSIEHLMAENIRNHEESVLDLSPMGCQTGFYLSIINDTSEEQVMEVLEKTLQDVLKAEEVPACNEVQCGWAANHSLDGAKEIAREMLSKRSEWHQVF